MATRRTPKWQEQTEHLPKLRIDPGSLATLSPYAGGRTTFYGAEIPVPSTRQAGADKDAWKNLALTYKFDSGIEVELEYRHAFMPVFPAATMVFPAPSTPLYAFSMSGDFTAIPSM